MTIEHHLQDATLMAYATGSLPEAFNLIVATHVSLCDQCRATVESFDALGGAVMGGIAPVTMAATSLEQTMAKLKNQTPPKRDAQPVQRVAQILPAPLRPYVGGGLDKVKWKPLGLGAKHAILSTSEEATARLLFIPAGVAMPDHTHTGTEMTMVLQGAFHDEDGTFRRGDVEVADQDVTHMPIADISEDCICLAVTDARLQFKGVLPRIMGRLAGI